MFKVVLIGTLRNVYIRYTSLKCMADITSHLPKGCFLQDKSELPLVQKLFNLLISKADPNKRIGNSPISRER